MEPQQDLQTIEFKQVVDITLAFSQRTVDISLDNCLFFSLYIHGLINRFSECFSLREWQVKLPDPTRGTNLNYAKGG
jgi:hypothetical protein